MAYLVTLLALAAVGTVAWWRPMYRRQLLLGALFTVPLVLINILLAGSWHRLGFNVFDVALSTSTMFLGVVAVGALGVVGYEVVLQWWGGAAIQPERRKLWWLAIGIVATLIAWGFGWPPFLAVLGGLIVEMLILGNLGSNLWFDVVSADLGFALWYVLADVVFGFRAAGDLTMLQIGGHPIGVTLDGLPIERLLIVAAVGALIAPLFSALKRWRLPHYPTAAPNPRVKAMIALLFLVAFTITASWFTFVFVLPPRVLALTPMQTTNAMPAATISIQFNHPVDRQALTLDVQPPIAGSWSFEGPSAGHHAFVRAIFTPETTLTPGTTYHGQVRGISSIWGLTAPATPFTFTTLAPPRVTTAPNVRTTVEPCGKIPVTIDVPTTDFTAIGFVFDPAATASTAVSTDGLTYTLTPQPCLAPGTTYHLHVTEQTRYRDPSTNELVAVGDASDVAVITLLTSTPPVVVVAPVPAPTPPPVHVTPPTPAPPKIATVVRPQKILSIAVDYQDQPLSCEAAALKMALAGHGVTVSESQIMAQIGYDPTPRKNGIWGDPYQAFVGNIDGKQNTTGYGVYWDPIARAASHWRSTRILRHATVTDLTAAIDADDPVVIWGTIGSATRDQWTTTTGKTINAWKGEHARTVIGYIGTAAQPTRFILNDPVAGRITWSIATLMSNWSYFSNSGVVVE